MASLACLRKMHYLCPVIHNDMDLSNLRNKTVFDLCNDRKKIAEFIPTAANPDFNLEEYSRFCRENPTNNALHMTLLANVLSDNALSRAVQQEFASELKAFFAGK